MQHIVNESMEKRAGYNLQFLKNSTRKSRVQDDGICQQRHLFLYSLIYLAVCKWQACYIGRYREGAGMGASPMEHEPRRSGKSPGSQLSESF